MGGWVAGTAGGKMKHCRVNHSEVCPGQSRNTIFVRNGRLNFTSITKSLAAHLLIESTMLRGTKNVHMEHAAMSSELIKLQNQAVRPQQAQRPSVCKIESKV